MLNLKIKIVSSQLVLSGSINATRTLDEGSDLIQIKLSNGVNLQYSFDEKHDIWILEHTNQSLKQKHTNYKLTPSNEYGVNDSIEFDYPVSTAWVTVNKIGLRLYGDPVMSKDETEVYDNLVKYLTDRGVICVEEIKKDLKLIVTRNYSAHETA